ncbi:sigma-70 family RNA polymerase sigma factor [Paenibacillus nanensis]|uniref:sigma-70 family RNA polymerase sigma factor n=1 Tax=Paenibacillus nanensis TaxID=393251 RepID=UPI001F0BDF1D|nr:sigma-70 family RNA polymerase sigma factor [Paenibacillus nanensis]
MNPIAVIEPYLPDLRLYCRALASSEWDAEDLMQETLLKAYRSLEQAPERQVSKSYLRLIAKNVWIDQYRKRKAAGDSVTFDEALHLAEASPVSELTVRESLEQLAGRLNPRQMVLILLVDVFRFSAAETGELLHMTVGAVKEGLKRARRRLRTMMNDTNDWRTDRAKPSTGPSDGMLTKESFEQFLSAFREGDAEGICTAYLALASRGMQVESVSVQSGRYSFTFRDPNGHLIEIFQAK